MSEQDTPPCQADGSDGPSARTLRSQILSKAEGMPPAERNPKVNPIRTARWIWPTPQMDLHNCYAHFRRDFELDKAPDEAPLCITADKAYKLYVNGRFVCRGPARGYQDHWPFDEVDLAGVLQAGHNWLAVEAYTPGISTFQYLHQSWAGLLAGARWGDFELLTGEGWLMRRSPLHTQWTARLSRQMDFQEHVGARRASREWITSPTPPEPGAEGWGRSDEGIVFGRPPWNDVEPRGIPLLREELIAPGPVVWHAEGTSGEDYADRYNVSWGWVEEARRAESEDDGSAVHAETEGAALCLQIEPTGEGRWRAIAVDAGEYVVGDLVVEVEGAKGCEILDFQHCEGLVDGRPALHAPGSACHIALANRLRPGPGGCRHEFFHLLGFRYLTIIARDVSRPLTLRFSVRRAGYPFDMRGRFECSDGLLEEIHAACRRTQQVCALDAYVDTPWREQAQWWGDARVQAANTFYLDGDARLLARGIRGIAGQRGVGGLTYGHAPTCGHNCILPDFSLTWILTLWDHYWQTGETELFRELLPRVQEVLSYFNSQPARGLHGLLRHDRRLWYFGDWADLFKGEIPTLLNLWYLLTLRRLTALLEAAGMGDAAENWTGKADAHAELVTERLYDPEARLFRDGLDADGRPAAHCSVHEQTVALMLGLAPEAHETMLRERLLPYVRGETLDCAVPSAFWCAYVLRELGRRGYGEDVVAFIRRRWEPMAASGTTWEGFEWSESGGSMSHAWSAHPSFHLVNVLAGIRQTAPGWAEVTCSPCIAEGIDRVRALVPSPHGNIEASWQCETDRIQVTLDVPEAVQVRLETPETVRTAAGALPIVSRVRRH